MMCAPLCPFEVEALASVVVSATLDPLLVVALCALSFGYVLGWTSRR